MLQANVGAKVKEPKFIRTLVTAIFENSIVKKKLNPDTLKNHYHLIHRFVDGNPQYELECLYALQSLINKLEHPQGKRNILLISWSKRLFISFLFSEKFINRIIIKFNSVWILWIQKSKFVIYLFRSSFVNMWQIVWRRHLPPRQFYCLGNERWSSGTGRQR